MKKNINVHVKGRNDRVIVGYAEICRIITHEGDQDKGEVVEVRKRYFKVDILKNTCEVEEGVSMSDAIQIVQKISQMEKKNFNLLYKEKIT